MKVELIFPFNDDGFTQIYYNTYRVWNVLFYYNVSFLQTAWQANNGGSSTGITTMPKRKRRTRVPDKPNYPLNLWSIMKNSIGKELSKIPMPVNFSEPLSMLQRLTEDYEYAHILDRFVLLFL